MARDTDRKQELEKSTYKLGNFSNNDKITILITLVLKEVTDFMPRLYVYIYLLKDIIAWLRQFSKEAENETVPHRAHKDSIREWIDMTYTGRRESTEIQLVLRVPMTASRVRILL